MDKMFNEVKQFARSGVARIGAGSLALTVPLLSHAADTDPIALIGTAQTTALAVAGALVGLVIAVWAALYVKKFFGK